MGPAVPSAKTSLGPWDACADVDGFLDQVLAELEAMERDGTRPQRSGSKRPLAGATLRKAVMAIWCVFCDAQWRAIGLLSDIPFGTLYGPFARWTWLGLWRRRFDCGDGLRAHADERRATEVGVAVDVPNRMLELGRPNNVCIA